MSFCFCGDVCCAAGGEAAREVHVCPHGTRTVFTWFVLVAMLIFCWNVERAWGKTSGLVTLHSIKKHRTQVLDLSLQQIMQDLWLEELCLSGQGTAALITVQSK